MGGFAGIVEGHQAIAVPVVVGLRLPIENPKAVPSGKAAVFGDDIRQEVERVGGVADGHAHFRKDYGLAVTGDHVVHVGQALAVQRGPIGRGGIERHADHVPIGTGGFEAVEHPSEKGVVVAVGDVDDHLGVGENFFHCPVPAVDQLGQTGKPVH
jgi:hypothetical protein